MRASLNFYICAFLKYIVRHIFCLLLFLVTATVFAGSNNYAPFIQNPQATFPVQKASLPAADLQAVFHVKVVSEITAEEEFKSEKETEEFVLENAAQHLSGYLAKQTTSLCGTVGPHVYQIPLYIFYHSWKSHLAILR